MWPSVRKGEEENIFPFQEEADVMFNSALIYELAVLKPYVEAQLFGVERECPEYIEAKRLLKFLDYFVGIGSEKVPTNSLLREFIGGGGSLRKRYFFCINAISCSIKINPNDSRYRLDLLIYLDFT